ncbi:MAG: type IV secretory system conjugative DNA transfer family protein [Bacteroidia bacterium]|nr:type IV secretory system conjugative DNA transfer family protein [Bacteroidia bacterium]
MNDYALRLGNFEQTGHEYTFEGSESLITIAMPGRGKSQGHVIRNLYFLEGPVIVLDVKPEIYEEVGQFRQTCIGPSIVFAPGNREGLSATYNPLDAISSDPVAAYTQIGQLVPLLMVPAEAKNAKSFWEGRAAQMLQAAIYDVCLNTDSQPSKLRDMTAVVDWFSQSPRQLAGTIGRLQTSPLRVLQRVGNQLEASDEEVRANVFDSVLRHIEIWGAPQLEHLVGHTSFDLADFRSSKKSLYLCVTIEELTQFRPILRALLGQVFYHLREQKEDWNGPKVTFFLDEFPQLGFMPEIEQMIALGRQMGLRLWLFAQTTGQLALTYGDANRILDMMLIRCYIQPTGKMAEDVSRELGSTRDIYSGKERPLATPQELAGPEYAGRVIVFEAGRRPARLNLVMAYNDPLIQRKKYLISQ